MLKVPKFNFGNNFLSRYVQLWTSSEHTSGMWFGTHVFSVFIVLAVLFFASCKLYQKHRANARIIHQPRTTRQQFESDSIHLRKWCWMVAGCLVVISFIWEAINIYQQEMAKKAAVVVKGAPHECHPDSMTLWDSLAAALRSTFTWSEDRCKEYYKAVLVDPLWEVTPLKVLFSMIVQCISPLEKLSSVAGASFHNFMREIPVQWQLMIVLLGFVIIMTVTLVIILACCGYTLHVPFVIKLGPTERHIREVTVRNRNRLGNGQESSKKSSRKAITCKSSS